MVDLITQLNEEGDLIVREQIIQFNSEFNLFPVISLRCPSNPVSNS